MNHKAEHLVPGSWVKHQTLMYVGKEPTCTLYVPVCACVWKPGVTIGFFLSLLLSFGDGLTESWAHRFSWAVWLVSPRYLPVSIFPVAGIMRTCHSPQVFCEYWGLSWGPCVRELLLGDESSLQLYLISLQTKQNSIKWLVFLVIYLV